MKRENCKDTMCQHQTASKHSTELKIKKIIRIGSTKIASKAELKRTDNLKLVIYTCSF